MSPLSIPRRVHVIGLLGSALLISGLFLPWIITTFSEPFPHSDTSSFWLLLVGQVTFLRFDWSSGAIVGFYFFPLLPLLTGILTSLAGLFGKGKRVFFVLHLIFVIVSLCVFLFISYIGYCLFYCGATGPWALRGTRVLAPGFWLILGGFLVSLGVSIAQNKVFKLRAT
ncbi:MAG TPA: hypothetical protein VHZ51_00890 [Ktedonobacteraceae bacterium]|jgi:hypothetical protein|nr:hypothetical protein [Ktedonobacteraceae bacterium]